MDTYMNEFDFLREQAVSEDLIKEILKFRKEYTVAADAVGRVQQPAIHFYGKETLEMAHGCPSPGGKSSSHRA